MLTEPIAVTLHVTDILENLNITYVIGGSMAGAVHGVMRATMDVDLVANLRPEHTDPLAQALGDAFYADVDTISQAIRQQTSFNILHLDTMFKVDIFVAKPRLFDRSQLDRRQLQQLSLEPERYAYVASAEDIILAKLEWYRMGGEVSERQWQDVLGGYSNHKPLIIQLGISGMDLGEKKRKLAPEHKMGTRFQATRAEFSSGGNRKQPCPIIG